GAGAGLAVHALYYRRSEPTGPVIAERLPPPRSPDRRRYRHPEARKTPRATSSPPTKNGAALFARKRQGQRFPSLRREECRQQRRRTFPGQGGGIQKML